MEEVLSFLNKEVVDRWVLGIIEAPPPPQENSVGLFDDFSLDLGGFLFGSNNATQNNNLNELDRIEVSFLGSKWSILNYDPEYSLSRQIVVMWILLYLSSLLLYFSCSSVTYYLFFFRERQEKSGKTHDQNTRNEAYWKFDGEQLFNEIFTSVWSLFIMAGMTVPLELAHVYGLGRIYQNVSDYGWGYLLLSFPLFLIFTDSLIYWIHRGLHWGPLYKIHKLHHLYKQTSPFSAFSFHPLDGWSQGLPYHLFPFIFPMHSYMYLVALGVVALWTINIHDRVTFDIWGVNGAAHHTVHHEKFNYNYGQYFTFWDRMCGTFKDPKQSFPYKKED